MKSSLFFASVSCLALVGAFPAPAIAQESAASGEDQTSVLETVVVTSTKRAENQQDVGLTVQTLSGNDIRDLGVDNLEDVMNLVPGTGFLDSAGGGIPIVVIRGSACRTFVSMIRRQRRFMSMKSIRHQLHRRSRPCSMWSVLKS